ncbi:GA module-containing protein, partial [Ureaplasma diversum]|uniref:GA module-containing protein n=1 Tax=Ureaplasma diversum TaxID=42094 RepID=UPI000571F83A
QTGGNESSNPGSGSTTNPSGQGSNNGGTTNPSGGSNNNTPETTQHSTPQASPNTGETPNVTQPPKQGESGATPDNTTKNEHGDQGSNNVDSEAEKKKKEQEEQAAKQKEAEDALKAKKEQANTTISGLINLSDEERKVFTDKVEKITDPTKSDEIDAVVEEAKAKAKDAENKKKQEMNPGGNANSNANNQEGSGSENSQEGEASPPATGDAKQNADQELKTKKDTAKSTINDLKNLSESEKKTFTDKIELITQSSREDEIKTIIDEAKALDSKKLAIKNKLTIKSFTKNGNYLKLTISTSDETYNKIKDNTLVLEFKNNNNLFVKDSTGTWKDRNTGKTLYNVNNVSKNGVTTFDVETLSPWANFGKVTLKVVSIVSSADKTKMNILNNESSEINLA